jgi:two-component system OmpR family sensor kinase
VVLLAVLLTIAGGVEYSLLRQTVITSRAQTMTATFREARGLVLREERVRVRHQRPPLSAAEVARDLAVEIASSGVSAIVLNTNLVVEASASPGTAPNQEVVSGAQIPHASQGVLLAAAQFDTTSNPTLLSGPPTGALVMVFPLAGAAGADLGAVELGVPRGPIDSELGTAALVLALGEMFVLLVALGIGLLLARRSLGPLQRLTSVAAALGGGDLSQRSELPPRRDEVGVLAGVFDEMAESVERTVRVREEAERQMRQFIADASHELRTPLTAIKGYLEVLQRGAADDPVTVTKALTTMSQEADRMRRLVTDLLALARADSGRTVEVRAIDLTDFLAEFLDEHEAAVERELAPGLVVLADPQALLTICSNLQANAERHGEGKSIRWSTVEAGEWIGFRCADSGPGIAADDLPHVFERFYRASSSRSRQDGGSGLGLAIVHSLVEAQDGRVRVESAPGQGTAFTVLLPRSASKAWTSP